ncbi:hypothetical protein [Streptomyces turgidiscabies]|uniref:hypothetical protein n=1 Tax=Streptomyces turgidiscabies TaxID=85558 RepID=UPI0038F771BC
MKKQLRLDGSVDIPSDEEPLERNANGSVPAAHLKAVTWYAITHGLKVQATNTWPTYYFTAQQGGEVEADLRDILKEYDDFKQKTHNKAQAAA